ncbi:ABC transporter permease subunit [Cellulomonas iranensis]|uniref:ABC transporter permease subunit n=1 Tax=Cellulomonas iranensis TaxID=76862 RepID=UPI0013D194BD|nr:ABC transporter permease subunit [Cellulomonas iranensis]
MSATATSPAAPTRTRASAARVSFFGVVRSEWIKLWSVRSTYWVIAVMLVVMPLFAWPVALSADFMVTTLDTTPGSAVIVAAVLTPGQMFGSLTLVVLAALAVTGEYGTGQIRSTLTAVPARLPVLWAKALVVFVVTFVTAALGTALALLVASAVKASAQPDWSDPEMLRAVLGVPLYVATLSLLGFVIGALLRNTAATIAIVIGFVLVIENVLLLLSWKPLEWVRPFLPAAAGQRVAMPEQLIEANNQASSLAVHLGPWAGYAVLLAWVVVLGTAAAVRLRTRDA